MGGEVQKIRESGGREIEGKVVVTLFQRWFEFKITLWRVLGERAAT